MRFINYLMEPQVAARTSERLRFASASRSHSRYQYGNMRFNDPSRFLDEISDRNLDSIISIHKKPEFPEPKILGNFKPLGSKKPMLSVNVDDFVAANPNDIKPGMEVIHLKFGQGKVMKTSDL